MAEPLSNSFKAAAIELDASDEIAAFRDRFHIPRTPDGEEVVYLTGNSLGLQPKTTRDLVNAELDDWQRLGVEGHLHARTPWLPYHEYLTGPMAKIVGALPIETVVMNSLTVNLHLLMVSFYRPTPERFKIVIEKGAFPSDRYAVESQIKFHGFDPADALIEIAPRAGTATLVTDDICRTIAELGDSLALVMFAGVNYYTGQAFDMKAIAAAGRKAGAFVGFDLAHAAGNISLELHDWDADFAAWCSYKYLNAGPGGIAAAFVHERHAADPDIPRFAGWWGNNKERRFLMQPEFEPLAGAEGWQLSNPPIFQLAALRASLEIFEEAGMQRLVDKSAKLTGFLSDLLAAIQTTRIEIITPNEPPARGCQLSIRVEDADKALFDAITKRGVVADWREPDVIRVAPVPLYNSFADVLRFAEILADSL